MVQETTTQSWGSRIGNAFIGMIIGFFLIIGSFYLIFWNEANGLHTAQSLQATQKILITVPATPIDSKNELQVVYITGLATTANFLTDSLFGISDKAIKLNRKVEMYQWKESVETKKEKNFGGSETEVKTYEYNPVWSDENIDSSQFKDQAGHENPSSKLLNSNQQYSTKVTVGDFTLPSKLLNEIDVVTPIDLSNTDLTAIEAQINKSLPVQHNGADIYIGVAPPKPAIGDLKIHLSEVLPQAVSIIGQQRGNTLQAYLPPAGKPVLLLETGTASPDQMILDAKSANKVQTWMLRGVALLMMIIAISLVQRPVVVLADVIPIFGSIVSVGTGFIAVVVGLILWTIATAIAWFTVRPVWSIGLIALVVVICYTIIISKRKSKPV